MLPTTLSQHLAISRIVSALAIMSLQDGQLSRLYPARCAFVGVCKHPRQLFNTCMNCQRGAVVASFSPQCQFAFSFPPIDIEFFSKGNSP